MLIGAPAERVVALALQLGADQVEGWSDAELRLAQSADEHPAELAELVAVEGQMRLGQDPLGAVVMSLSPQVRRPLGVTYTPQPIIDSMVRWASTAGNPTRVVDAGCGSGRFIVAAGQIFPNAQLVAVDFDPLACILTRAALAVSGMAERSRVLNQDYRQPLPRQAGPTLFIGNPPYVRHHQLGESSKRWLAMTAHDYGYAASKLAGLHVHFFLATLQHASRSDYGAFVTSAEWLDVNYGRLVRELLLGGLGGTAIHLVEPEAAPFEGTATTAAITCFHVGEKPPTVRLRRVKSIDELGALEGGKPVRRSRLAEADRWTILTRAPDRTPEGFVELGELCRVHRGAVTGANATWVTSPDDRSLPLSVLFASVTRARELFAAGAWLESAHGLRAVIDIPSDLDVLDCDDKQLVEKFLRAAQRNGAADGYIARNRKPWWKVRLREPAPILATYMARRPPTFVRNLVDARHINIAHGLYPRQHLPATALDRLAAALRNTVTQDQGRTYAGGLTKFEPREMERLPVPDLSFLL
ncbi:MAG: Eco57I restriction-modification methylase domain-containing protein [Egibacteraceae bacterium]